ncbi:MAG: type II toxin-antitoxin system RelE/ParE family toxin [Holosporales bacterium]|jgi:proteic killer suppression protein
MIKNFACKETEKIFLQAHSKKLPSEIAKRAFLKLRQLDAVSTLSDLLVPPSNRLEALHGDRKGYYSLRINNQWRLCFLWDNGAAREVEIVDYH